MAKHTRRKFLEVLGAAGLITGYLVASGKLSITLPPLPTGTGTTTTTTLLPPASLADVLTYHGLTGRTQIAYGNPFYAGLGTFSTFEAMMAYYLAQNWKGYPLQDGSNGLISSWAQVVAAYKAAGGFVLGPTAGWGYYVQFFSPGTGATNTTQLWPDEQEFIISNGALTPAISYKTFTGITIDSPELITQAWPPLYQKMDAAFGLKNLAGIGGWVNADGVTNDGGGKYGGNGGHNMNAYRRYVNNEPGLAQNLYLGDVNAGAHNVDGTICQLWTLKGSSQKFSGAAIQPTLLMANDVANYHHGFGNSTQNPQGLNQQNSSFGIYMLQCNQRLEASLLAAVANKTNGNAFASTGFPLSIIKATSYNSAIISTTTSSIYQINASTPTLQQTPFANLANDDDNGSNPGRTGIDEVMTPATATNFWVNIVPSLGANSPLLQVDTLPGLIVQQVQACNWSQYALAYGKLTLDALYVNHVTSQKFEPNGIITNVLGRKGNKKQVWISNTSEESQYVQRKLNAKRFDMENPGRSIDLFANRSIDTGGNDDIEFAIEIKPKHWAIIDVPSR